jgi:glutamate racemase
MIGIFDSGVGGLTVLRAICNRAPDADIVYFGDTENAPYGSKNKHEIAVLVAMALRRLHAAGAVNIVSACNTTSVAVLTSLIDLLRLNVFDIVEMVGPTVAALAPVKKRIALAGTRATIHSGIYQRAFADCGISVHAIPAPELAGLIETGGSGEHIHEVIHDVVKKAVEHNADILSLSCTHYPFVRDIFEECARELKSGISMFDPAGAVADEVVKRFPTEGAGNIRFLVSKESSIFATYVKQLFNDGPHTIEQTGSIYSALKTI